MTAPNDNTQLLPPKQEGYLELQPYTPYPQALRWKIQSSYYSRKGVNAWLDKDVPDTITCNSLAAMNNATIVLDAVTRQEALGSLSPDDPIVVLEYGAGSGLFAYNFIRRFEQVCQREKKNFAQRLIYIATDYLIEGVKTLSQQSFLKNDIRSGKLRIAMADVTATGPIIFVTPDADHPHGLKMDPTELPALSAVITNYLHCCLPVDFLRQEGEEWFTKSVSTSIQLTQSEMDTNVTAEDLITSDDVIARLVETERWDPVELNELCVDEQHHSSLQSVVSGRTTSQLLNAVGSIKSVRMINSLLREGGVYLIHDKGLVNTKPYDYDAGAGSSTHGGSTAFMTNFPLIKTYAELIGYQAYLTPSYQYLIQTLLLEKAQAPSHQKVFRYLYGDFNFNSDLVDLQNIALSLARSGDTHKAADAFAKCLRYRSLDAELYFLQGELYIDLDIPQRALLCAQKGRQLDHFQQYNFHFIEGQAHFKLENYTLSMKLLEKSIILCKNNTQIQKIEKALFDAHIAAGFPAEDFTSEIYPALERVEI
jgi:hypothetical protein